MLKIFWMLSIFVNVNKFMYIKIIWLFIVFKFDFGRNVIESYFFFL